MAQNVILLFKYFKKSGPPISFIFHESFYISLSLYLACRHIFNYLTEEEKKVVKELGYRLTNELQAGMVIPPNVLVASIILQHLQGLHTGMLTTLAFC